MMAAARPETKCQHDDVQFCPLYIAAHGTGHGCDDGRLGEIGCAVDRGMRYTAELELIRVKCPGLIEQAEWRCAMTRREVQRSHNLRLNGIH